MLAQVSHHVQLSVEKPQSQICLVYPNSAADSTSGKISDIVRFPFITQQSPELVTLLIILNILCGQYIGSQNPEGYK